MKTFKYTFGIYDIRKVFELEPARGSNQTLDNLKSLIEEIVEWCDHNFPDAFYQVEVFNFYTNDDNAAFGFKIRWM